MVYLYDYQENIIINFENDLYIFKSGKGVFNNRFILLFKIERVLGLGEIVIDFIDLFLNFIMKDINIFLLDVYLLNLEVFDLMGRKILQKIEEIKNIFILNFLNLKMGVYFIKIDIEKGNVIKKIIKK